MAGNRPVSRIALACAVATPSRPRRRVDTLTSMAAVFLVALLSVVVVAALEWALQ